MKRSSPIFIFLTLLLSVVLIGTIIFLVKKDSKTKESNTSRPQTSAMPLQSLVIPSEGVLLGIHPDIKEGVSEATKKEFTDFETEIGRKLAIDVAFQNWKPDSIPVGFPDVERAKWDAENGRVILISWRTDFVGDDANGGCATAKDILGGKYDAQLAEQADIVREAKVPFLVRWHFQFTNNEDNTCFNNGIDVKKDIKKAGENYVESWKHIVGIFREQGATNIQWVWAPSAGLFSNDDGSVNATDWKLFYPGNEYVDWVAGDNYNKTNTPQSFGDDPDIKNFYAETVGLGKPLMISQTGAPVSPTIKPDSATVWIQTAQEALKSKYPAIKAFGYRNGPGNNYELQGPALDAFKVLANDEHFTAMPVFQLAK